MFTKADIEKYFIAEKQESLLFMIIGTAGILAAIVFFFVLRQDFFKGAAIPLVLVGLLLGVVGYTVYARSDEDRKRNVYAYDLNPAELRDKELPRMKTVMKNFVTYRYTELFLLAAGIAIYLYYIRDIRNDFWRGFGLALALMAAIALAADYFAEKRGKTYIKGIELFTRQSA